jgi:c-di-GMP-binding flagellar brake protein YcgR
MRRGGGAKTVAMSTHSDSGAPAWGARTILSADDCLFHRGRLAHPGRLALSEDLLSFTPSRMLDRLAGATDFEIPLSAITDLAAGGIHHNVDIGVDEQSMRFSGRGAMRVHARLVALLAETEAPAEGEELLFEPGERVVLQGRAELYINDLVAVRGEVTLTDLRFRFMPGLGLERLLFSPAQIDVPLVEVTNAAMSGLRRLFACTIHDEAIQVGGTLAPDIYRHLHAMTGDDALPTSGPAGAIIETWKVQLRRGLLAHPGELEVTPRRLRFKPGGLLDSMVGVSDLDIELEQISGLKQVGWTEKKIELRTGHSTYVFTLADVDGRFEGLMELVRDRHHRLMEALKPGDSSAFVPCLDAWSERIRYDDSEQIVVSTVGVWPKGQKEYRMGWLLLTRSRLLFLPIGGPASKQPVLDIPLADICRLDGGPRTPGDQIYLSADEVPFRFFLADREGLVEEFWSQCRSPTRILSWETLGPRSLARINGEARFVRVVSHGDVVVDLSPGVTVPHADGVALLLPGEPGSSVPLERWVTVEIGQAEGIYQFDARVVRSAPLPMTVVVDDPEQMHLLITAFPSELRVYNQRNSYRVPTHMHLRAHVLAQVADGGSWMATGEAFECDLVDISIGGALVRSLQPMIENQRVSLNLPLMDKWIEIRATCIRSDEQEPEKAGVLYGMEFRELTTAQEDLLHKTIMQLQREVMAEEAEDADAED